MPLLWTPRTVPELAAVKKLPPEVRAQVWSRCWPRIRQHWQVWVAGAAAAALGLLVFFSLSQALAQSGITGLLNGALAGLTGGSLAGTIFAQVTNRFAVPYLREELANLKNDKELHSEPHPQPNKSKQNETPSPV